VHGNNLYVTPTKQNHNRLRTTADSKASCPLSILLPITRTTISARQNKPDATPKQTVLHPKLATPIPCHVIEHQRILLQEEYIPESHTVSTNRSNYSTRNAD